MRDYSRFQISVNGDPKFALFFSSLSEGPLKKRIDSVLTALKKQPDLGDLVGRALWPDEYKILGLHNLFRIEVGRGQRMIYTIRIEGANLDVDVLEFFATHKGYERRFHY